MTHSVRLSWWCVHIKPKVYRHVSLAILPWNTMSLYSPGNTVSLYHQTKQKKIEKKVPVALTYTWLSTKAFEASSPVLCAQLATVQIRSYAMNSWKLLFIVFKINTKLNHSWFEDESSASSSLSVTERDLCCPPRPWLTSNTLHPDALPKPGQTSDWGKARRNWRW